MSLNVEFVRHQGATAFVDTLFAALRSKSYVPYAPTNVTSSDQTQDGGIPIPLDLLSSTIPTSPENNRKRSYEGDDRDVRGPPKGPRLGNDTYFNRQGYPNGSSNPDNWQMGDYGMNGHGTRQNGRPMLPRGVCRDYHCAYYIISVSNMLNILLSVVKGFCSRGAMCKYSHDNAAITPQMPFAGSSQMGGNIPFMPMYNGLPFGMDNMQGQGYDPNEPKMDMQGRQGHQRVPTMPRADEQSMLRMGELPVVQDLTPAPAQGPSTNGAHQLVPGDNAGAADVTMHSPPSNSQQHLQAPVSGARPQRGGNRGRGRGGRGAFGEHASFGDQNENKTIVVEKIPEDHLSLEAVNNWFKRFGTVTNVAVDPSGGKALVSFSNHDEAFAAWKAEEAVFNNRFVKIFWHRPMAGQGGVGAKALQASAQLVANLTTRDSGPSTELPPAPKSVLTRPGPAAKPKPAKPSLTALQVKQQQLEKQIAEQKELMGKLSKATLVEKKEIMSRLRKLDSEMKSPSTPIPTTTPSAEDDKERKKKMLLDMELDMHAKATEENGVAQNGEDSNENLQEKLAKLREEAKALGITDMAGQAYAPAYRGYRGRGRGRGAFRGMRGAPPRLSNMRLDNRPKALLVKELNSQDSNVVQSVRSFYEVLMSFTVDWIKY